jgi:hypothetical protein
MSFPRAYVAGYRTAIHLNNVAVTMLEKGCLRQGLDTLQDGIAVMKAAIQQGSEAAVVDNTSKSSLISDDQWNNELIQRATSRSLSPEVVDAMNGKMSPTIEGNSTHIQSLAYEGAGLTPVMKFLHESPSMTHFFPIRIDALPMGWKQESSTGLVVDAEYEAVILLYNFGLANLMLSKLMDTAATDVAHRLRACSLSLFQLSSTILSRRSHSCKHGIEEADILQLAALVYHASIQVLVEAGNDFEVSVVHDRYERILLAISSIHFHFRAWDYSVNNVSPAA